MAKGAKNRATARRTASEKKGGKNSPCRFCSQSFVPFPCSLCLFSVSEHLEIKRLVVIGKLGMKFCQAKTG